MIKIVSVALLAVFVLYYIGTLKLQLAHGYVLIGFAVAVILIEVLIKAMSPKDK